MKWKQIIFDSEGLLQIRMRNISLEIALAPLSVIGKVNSLKYPWHYVVRGVMEILFIVLHAVYLTLTLCIGH